MFKVVVVFASLMFFVSCSSVKNNTSIQESVSVEKVGNGELRKKCFTDHNYDSCLEIHRRGEVDSDVAKYVMDILDARSAHDIESVMDKWSAEIYRFASELCVFTEEVHPFCLKSVAFKQIENFKKRLDRESKDSELALYKYGTKCQNGDQEACFFIGMCFFETSIEQAKKIFAPLCSKNHKPSCERISTIDRELNKRLGKLKELERILND